MSEAEILNLIGLDEGDINRYRGCDIYDDEIVVYARTGGGNRAYYPNHELIKNPYYLYDEDDSWDNTYANYHFAIPDKMEDTIEVEKEIPFPFQYIEAYFCGEMDFDVACDSTMEECERLIEEYIEDHKDGDCDRCKHSYEDETPDGYWQLYCMKKFNNEDGSAVPPYGWCHDFENK